MRSLSMIGMAAMLLLQIIACNETRPTGKRVQDATTTRQLAPQKEELDEVRLTPVTTEGKEKADEAVAVPPPAQDKEYNREGYAHIEENKFLAARQDG